MGQGQSVQYTVPGRPPQQNNQLDIRSRCKPAILIPDLVVLPEPPVPPVCLGVQHKEAQPGAVDTGMHQHHQDSTQLDPILPLHGEDLLFSKSCLKPAEPVAKVASLPAAWFYYNHGNEGKIFMDRKLPQTESIPAPHARFDNNFFKTLGDLVSAPGPTWPQGTPNHIGARVKLVHTNLNIAAWRRCLIGYEDIQICQYLEFGFPLGLETNPPAQLVPASQNHGSSYQFFPWVDQFAVSGVSNCYIAGPYGTQPFEHMHVTPLMTAVKKPDGRRVVFDATFGDFSLNKGTPQHVYQGQPIELTYPKIEDFRGLILKCGKGCFIFKRDMSSYFLQLPLDPADYAKVIFIWRCTVYFFLGLMFGLRNSGYQAQRVSDAVVWIHRNSGLDTDIEQPYNCLNYSDDLAGCEKTEERALASANQLLELFQKLGLKESSNKYHPPSTSMPFLGVQFDTVKLEMSIPADKLEEVRSEVNLWQKKKTATKKTLQQLLGRLFWVSKCVKFSRPFMGRLLQQLRDIHSQSDNKKSLLSEGSKQDIQWWHRYLRRFNGVEMIYRDEPLDLPLEDLLETSAIVNCGDAQVWGGGAYYGEEYWSRPFPDWLKDPTIWIHLKEFYVVLASCWLWGHEWTGKLVYIFSDNDAVVESLTHEKPRDPEMLKLVREFAYLACTRKFTPVFRKIGTKKNWEADFLSRCHDPVLIEKFYKERGLPPKNLVHVPDNFFKLSANW